jgi:PNKP (polynucleotide 5'-kinase/3'-phosphatase) family adenylyltransferase-like protein
VWTRTGRPFFDTAVTAQLVDQLRTAAETAGLFDELNTSWLLLDAELLPWSRRGPRLGALLDHGAGLCHRRHRAWPSGTDSFARKSPASP